MGIIDKGVSIVSPYLFNLYAEQIKWKSGLDSNEERLKIGGRNINALRYADGMRLVAENSSYLKEFLMKVKEECSHTGLQLNKTTVMTTEELHNFKANNEEIKIVKAFLYFASLINPNKGRSQENKKSKTLKSV